MSNIHNIYLLSLFLNFKKFKIGLKKEVKYVFGPSNFSEN